MAREVKGCFVVIMGSMGKYKGFEMDSKSSLRYRSYVAQYIFCDVWGLWVRRLVYKRLLRI